MRYLKVALAFIVLVLSAIIAYWAGERQHVDEVNDLNKQIADLQSAEYEVAVVRRVSKQMEEIAYQQKAISDEQRNEAVKQSELAIENARRAEAASLIAQASSKQAEEQRRQAEIDRQAAIEAEQEARSQRDNAQRQKMISDLLSLRSISRSLGSAAMSQYEKDSVALASSLAFASYYFVKQCDGNSYQSETFKSLATVSNSIKSSVLQNHSSVRRIVSNKNGIYAVTNYGEIVHSKLTGSQITNQFLFRDKRYDFRDIVCEGNTIWALNREGTLLRLPGETHYQLPQDYYSRVLLYDDRSLLLLGQQKLYWFSRHTNKIFYKYDLPSPVSCLALDDGKIHVFFENKKQAYIDRSGLLTFVTPFIDEKVTACVFDSNHLPYLGTDKGTVQIPLEEVMITLVSHSTSVTDVTLTDDKILISSSFDHTIKIWNLPKLQTESDYFKKAVAKNETSKPQSIDNEWIVPVSYTYDSWPFSLCLSDDQQYVWIGTDGGQISVLPVSVDNMAKAVQKNVRNFSPRDWQSYIGQISEPVDFTKVKL